MDFVGEAFVVEWATFVGQAPNWEEFRYWLNNCNEAGNIGQWE